MVRVFANGLGDRVSITGQFIPTIQKIVLDASLLNNQQVGIKGKVEKSWVAPYPTPWCSSYRNGSLRVNLNYCRQLYLPVNNKIKSYLYKCWGYKMATFNAMYVIWTHMHYRSQLLIEMHTLAMKDRELFVLISCYVEMMLFRIENRILLRVENFKTTGLSMRTKPLERPRRA